MKRTALIRRTPLRRKTPLQYYSRSTTYARRSRNEDYMEYCRWQPCSLRGKAPCHGRIDPDHAGLERGLGKKAPDSTCIALCRKHHEERTDRRGYFKDWDLDQMRLWCQRQIHFHQNLYKNLLALRQTPWRKKRA